MKILRRGYNYTDGLNQYGLLDAGLLFIAYVNDPQHFITLQTRLGRADRLNEYIQHIGSGVFFTPRRPEARPLHRPGALRLSVRFEGDPAAAARRTSFTNGGSERADPPPPCGAG